MHFTASLPVFLALGASVAAGPTNVRLQARTPEDIGFAVPPAPESTTTTPNAPQATTYPYKLEGCTVVTDVEGSLPSGCTCTNWDGVLPLLSKGEDQCVDTTLKAPPKSSGHSSGTTSSTSSTSGAGKGAAGTFALIVAVASLVAGIL